MAACDLAFGAELKELWLEYEAQESIESRWGRVLDRLHVPELFSWMQKHIDQCVAKGWLVDA